ncbi:MAG: hypothetical protein HAW67_03235, partial [Endozoicomonadaceae bacterium]|nr:hypothetical protein [Endozoicomonadaceae bacterium]
LIILMGYFWFNDQYNFLGDWTDFILSGFIVAIIYGAMEIRRYLFCDLHNLNKSKYEEEISISSMGFRLPEFVELANNAIAKEDVKAVSVYWGRTKVDELNKNIITNVEITLRNEQIIVLNSHSFPLKPLVYLLVYFDYPVQLIDDSATVKKRGALACTAIISFLAVVIFCL